MKSAASASTNSSLHRSPFLLALPVIIGLLAGVFVLDSASRVKEKAKFDEFALGDETTTYLGQVEGAQVHCHDLADFEKCSEGYKSSTRKDVVLWLGNSQVHAINQMKSGDETAAPIMHRRLKALGYYFLTFSQPNANLQEHYLLFEYLLDRFSVNALLLPIVFDDMRETGIRPTLEDAFSDEPLVAKLNQTLVGKKLLANFGAKDAAGNDMVALEDTVQEGSEQYLNDALADYSTIWAARQDLRGKLYLFLYKFRNWLFGINPSSVRRLIPGHYLSNKEAFQAILDTALKHSIKVLVYVVPLRSDVPVPYDASEYEKFKAEMKSIAQRGGVRFVSLENSVPGELWGTKKSTSIGGGQEFDFMHFKAEGHRLLAEQLGAELSAMLNK